MKKYSIVFCTVISAFGLMAFGYNHWNSNKACKNSPININIDMANAEVDLIYNVDSRFINRITKEDLLKAKSIVDILPRKATESIVNYYSTRVSILHGNEESDQRAVGTSEVLNHDQIKLLKTMNYSTNFYIRSDYQLKNDETGQLGNSYLTYYMTLIPEKEATYATGQSALIDYLKLGMKDKTAIIKQDKLQPGRVIFTVTKEGTIENVALTSTSGYPSVDDDLVELIRTIPGKWRPASNSNGEKVDQDLIFFFGTQGC